MAIKPGRRAEGEATAAGKHIFASGKNATGTVAATVMFMTRGWQQAGFVPSQIKRKTP